MLTEIAHRRRQWADYFDSQGIQYAFFSAANATALQQARRDALAAEDMRLARENLREDEEQYESSEAPDEKNAADFTAQKHTPPPGSDTSEEGREGVENYEEEELDCDRSWPDPRPSACLRGWERSSRLVDCSRGTSRRRRSTAADIPPSSRSSLLSSAAA